MKLNNAALLLFLLGSAGQADAISGVWCSAYRSEDQSCQAIRTIEPLNDTEARIRQISLATDKDALIKTVIEVRATVEGNSLCYRASSDAIEGISLFWTADVAPVVTSNDRAVPRKQVDASLKRNGILRIADGPRVCWSPTEPGYTFFPKTDALVLRVP